MGVYIGTNKYTGGPADPSSSMIPKSIGTAAGDIIYFSASATPVILPKGTAGQVLTMNSGATAPIWATPSGGGGGTTVTLPSGYNASTGITLNSSALTTVCNIGGVNLNLKASAGGTGYSFKYDEFTTFDTTDQGYLKVTVANTSSAEKLFTYVHVGSTYYQDVDQSDARVLVNITTDGTVSPGEHYLAISNQLSYTGNTLPLTVTPEMIEIDSVMPTFHQVSNSSGAWNDIPYGVTRLYSYIILNHNGSLIGSPAVFITWCGDYYEI